MELASSGLNISLCLQMSKRGGHVGDITHRDWYIQATDRAD